METNMYLEMAVLALILGLASGGSIKKLLDLKIRGIVLLIASVFMSLLPQIHAPGAFLMGYGEPAAITVAVLRYGFLLAFAVLNYRNAAVCIIGAGGILNFAAMLANGGRMPVTLAALGVKTKDISVTLLKNGKILNYKLADANTRLLPICDVIHAKGFYTYFLSFGDILISIGIFILIIKLMEPRRLIRLCDRFKARLKGQR